MSEIALNSAGLAVMPRSKRIRRRLTNLAAISVVLIVAGIVGSFSTTVFLRIAQGLPPYSAFIKHLVFAGIGILISIGLILLFARYYRVKSWLKYIIPVLFFAALAMVIAVKFSSHGVDALGATRGLDLGFVRFQPSELLKVMLVLYLAQLLCWWRRPPVYSKAKQQSDIDPPVFKLKDWFTSAVRERPVTPDLPKRCMLIMLGAFGFTVIQPDLGSALIILTAGLITAVIAGVRIRQLVLFGVVIILLGFLALLVFPGKYEYARQRISTWMNPLQNSDSAAYQITQARGAIAGGGVWGRGYLKSDQKMNRLPLSTNDFVFPILVEELGFIGGLAIISMFVALGLFGIQLGGELEDPFARTAVSALGLTICLQGLVNIATTIGTLPLSGMTLPFFSQGGTSLIISIAALGTMLALGFSGLKQAELQESRELH